MPQAIWKTGQGMPTAVESTPVDEYLDDAFSLADKSGVESVSSLLNIQCAHSGLKLLHKHCPALETLEYHDDPAAHEFFDLSCDIILMVAFWIDGGWKASVEWIKELVGTHPNIRRCVDDWKSRAHQHPTICDRLRPLIEDLEDQLRVFRACLAAQDSADSGGMDNDVNNSNTRAPKVKIALLADGTLLACNGDSPMIFQLVFEWCDCVQAAHYALSTQETMQRCWTTLCPVVSARVAIDSRNPYQPA